MKESKIKSILAREILDSRGNPTVDVEVETTNGIVAHSSVPSGASTGSFEAIELRDGNLNRYDGKGVLKAISNVNDIIAPELREKSVFEQQEIDNIMILLDGTENKKRLGANAILGVSMAVAKAAAFELNIPLYRYIGGISGTVLPRPMMNILNGGKHADNNITIQEFMIIPVSDVEFDECIRMCTEVFHSLKSILKEKGFTTSVGDEGGFAPNLSSDEEAFDILIKAIEKAGYNPGEDFMISIDAATTEMYEEAKKIDQEGKYYFWKTNELKTKEELIKYWENIANKYPIFSYEDVAAEEDWETWAKLTERLGEKIVLVGDDLFVTNPKRLQIGIEKRIANAILIKLNQIGTVSETLEVIRMAHESGYETIISHRSGETPDTFIADLAVAVNAGQIKTGAPCRSDRVAKYNRLLLIENEINQ
jgi:enolase